MMSYQVATVARRKVFVTNSGSSSNFDLRSNLGNPTDQLEVYWKVNSGVVLGDPGSAGYGARTGSTSWAPGTRVWLTSRGSINGYQGAGGSQGAHGAGGPGGGEATPGSAGGGGTPGTPGSPGGPALVLNVQTIIDNTSGALNGGVAGVGGPGGFGGAGGGGGGINGLF